MTVLEVLMRGAAAGALLATALGLLRGNARTPARWTGALCCLCVAAFAVHSEGPETDALGVLRPLVSLLSAAGAASFWLFTVTLFDDRRPRWTRAAPLAALLAIALLARTTAAPARDALWVAYHLTALALLAHLLGVLWRHRADDLVEARRRVRPLFLLVAIASAAAMAGLQIATQLGAPVTAESPAQAAALLLLALAAAWVLLTAPAPLYEPAAERAVATPARMDARGDPDVGGKAAPDEPAPRFVDVRDRLQLDALQALLDRDESLWRSEGLSIGRLATAMKLPEHRLRRLINQGLGHRNFADFLNARRIAAAQAALGDPARANEAVSTIAFALGYASLGPFNRAFRAATGTTPTAWRAEALARARAGAGATPDTGDAGTA